jgi:hypothetical protein
MSVVAIKEDTRIPIAYKGPVKVKFLGDIYGKAIYALRDAGKEYKAQQMKERINQSGSPSETLKIIKDFVRFD